jgi:nicotinamide-nucleotide amidase
VEEELKRRLGTHIYGRDGETLEAVVGRLLVEQGLTLAVAESCTGGRLGDMFTNVPGSSRYFLGGVTAYSNEVKEKVLGVSGTLLEEKGAVSEAVAGAMARGARQLTGADFTLGVTGVAGPDGGTAAKPVGLVYMALAWEGGSRCQELIFHGNREAVKARTAAAAINMLRLELLGRQG